jgi:hypothetical protein
MAAAMRASSPWVLVTHGDVYQTKPAQSGQQDQAAINPAERTSSVPPKCKVSPGQTLDRVRQAVRVSWVTVLRVSEDRLGAMSGATVRSLSDSLGPMQADS